MAATKAGLKPPGAKDAAVLGRHARDVVTALDRILNLLIRITPCRETDWKEPLTFQELRAITTILQTGGVSMSALASMLGVSLPTATYLADRLVAKGLVVRIRPEHDRRLVLVAPSEEAKATQRAFFEHRVALFTGILESLSPPEREQAAGLLGFLARSVQSHTAG
ncbi:MAG: MarR family transcriptional regulator [Bryobacterales bacterium]|nr:MarR family transcriptional regulator [Bryobacterales bacterium]